MQFDGLRQATNQYAIPDAISSIFDRFDALVGHLVYDEDHRDGPKQRRQTARDGRRKASDAVSAGGEEAEQDAGSEEEGVEGDPFVYAVEQGGEVELGWKSEGGEPEVADAKLVKGLGVGAGGEHVRQGAGCGILGLDGGCHVVDEGSVEGGLDGWEPGLPLHLYVGADDLV